ncbi:MAG: membrane associated rhomboid family serine protease, partial [Bacteroidia bacterium]
QLLFPPISLKLKYIVTFYGLYELYRGIANHPGDNVAHFAHLGGLIVGIIIVKYWNKTRRDSFF